jgi:ribosome-associated protein
MEKIDYDITTTVSLSHEPVELFKILKFANLAASGGEAKQVIAEGLVRVNGEVETRKRRRMYTGDTIGFEGEIIKLQGRTAEAGEET